MRTGCGLEPSEAQTMAEVVIHNAPSSFGGKNKPQAAVGAPWTQACSPDKRGDSRCWKRVRVIPSEGRGLTFQHRTRGEPAHRGQARPGEAAFGKVAPPAGQAPSKHTGACRLPFRPGSRRRLLSPPLPSASPSRGHPAHLSASGPSA